jgi:V8-like Glu-specific endopeptidase
MLTLLLSLLALTPAHANELAEDAIYNGHAVAADGQTWKSTVGLSYSTGGCSGVFIEENVILTAAHCAIKADSELTLTMYKENDPEKVEYIYLAKEDFKYTSHPGYVKSLYSASTNDIAVIYLKNKTIPEGFTPAQVLTASNTSAGDIGRAAYSAGLGGTGHDVNATKLTFAQGTFTSYEYGGAVRIDFRGSGVCPGDSGGPVFAKAGGVLYVAALNMQIETNIGGNCGTVLYASVINAERYNWFTRVIKAQRGY